ncbi:MAG: tyrosine-type recombinase/integrase [Cyanobacteria bacterium P01_H01_bin.153]
MPQASVKRRKPKGSVAVLSSNGRLQLRFSYGGKRHYLSTGYSDTPQHRQLADIRAKEIEKDILYERFDPRNLVKYQPQALQAQSSPAIEESAIQVVTLSELWRQYTEFKRPGLSPSTLAKDYVRVARCLQNDLPDKSFEDAVAIRNWLVRHKTPNATKRILTQLKACCDWGKKSRLIKDNPFTGMAADIKIPKGSLEDTDINPFTLVERDLIVTGFREDRFYSYYAGFIEFLFLTGCRPSEAVALQWQHISRDYHLIRFEQAVVISEAGLVCKKGLKTQKKRTFPANAKLAALLKGIKPHETRPETMVFPSPEGHWIDVHNFTNRAWRKVIAKLEAIEYRKLYQTRHTFITAALETPIPTENGSVRMLDAKDVARLVGTSSKMIYEHYAGHFRELAVPEL